MNEKEFEEMLNLNEEMSIDTSVEKTLKKTMEKQINKRVFRSVLLIFVGIIGFAFILSILFDQLFYNAEETSPYLESEYEYSKFTLLMDIYIGLNYPGRMYYPLTDKSESPGFGKHVLYAKIQDDSSPLCIDGQYNSVFEIKRNKLSIEMLTNETKLTVQVSEFYNDSKEDEYSGYVKEMLSISEEELEEIQKLPESAIIKASVSFKEALPLNETLAFIKKYPDSNFVWIALDSQERFDKGTYDGIDLTQTIYYDFTAETKEKYPYLMLEKDVLECTAEELALSYRSRLQILNDNPEFMNLINSRFGDFVTLAREKELRELRLIEIEEKGIYSMGVHGNIRKQDFLDMIAAGDIAYADIQNVKLSVLSR